MPGESRAVRFVKPTPVRVEMASTSTPGDDGLHRRDVWKSDHRLGPIWSRTTIGVAPLSHASVR